jgi:hypothetical protein
MLLGAVKGELLVGSVVVDLSCDVALEDYVGGSPGGDVDIDCLPAPSERRACDLPSTARGRYIATLAVRSADRGTGIR